MNQSIQQYRQLIQTIQRILPQKQPSSPQRNHQNIRYIPTSKRIRYYDLQMEALFNIQSILKIKVKKKLLLAFHYILEYNQNIDLLLSRHNRAKQEQAKIYTQRTPPKRYICTTPRISRFTELFQVLTNLRKDQYNSTTKDKYQYLSKRNKRKSLKQIVSRLKTINSKSAAKSKEYKPSVFFESVSKQSKYKTGQRVNQNDRVENLSSSVFQSA